MRWYLKLAFGQSSTYFGGTPDDPYMGFGQVIMSRTRNNSSKMEIVFLHQILTIFTNAPVSLTAKELTCILTPTKVASSGVGR
jgi:hypothetical protein